MDNLARLDSEVFSVTYHSILSISNTSANTIIRVNATYHSQEGAQSQGLEMSVLIQILLYLMLGEIWD